MLHLLLITRITLFLASLLLSDPTLLPRVITIQSQVTSKTSLPAFIHQPQLFGARALQHLRDLLACALHVIRARLCSLCFAAPLRLVACTVAVLVLTTCLAAWVSTSFLYTTQLAHRRSVVSAELRVVSTHESYSFQVCNAIRYSPVTIISVVISIISTFNKQIAAKF